MTSDNKYLENTYYIIANAYRKQGKYQSAITTLEKLKKIEGYPKNEQYFYYH
jgi:tetratricopeptide (TPR) repeat protein